MYDIECPLHEDAGCSPHTNCYIPQMLADLPRDVVESAIAEISESMSDADRTEFWDSWALKNKGVQLQLLKIQILRKS